MTIIVEDGTGVQGAETYASIEFITAYWGKRTHSALFTAWDGEGDDEKKEGAAREATSYLDAVYGNFYKGTRRGYAQGLLWPRSGALDAKNYPLPDLPEELKAAVAELAARRISTGTELSPDVDPLAMVTREKKKIGPIEKELEYASPVSVGGKSATIRYGAVEGLLSMLLTNSPGSSGTWAWA